jgi:hypothetical protein
MKSTFTILVLSIILSSCSNVPAAGDIQTLITQTSVVQSLENSTLQPTTQVATPTTTITHSMVIASPTPKLQNPESTPTPLQTLIPTITLTSDTPSTAISGNAMVADHTAIDKFESIPSNALASAAGLKTLFMHQSTGNNIDFLGLQCLEGLQNDPSVFPQECISFARTPYIPYDYRNWNWKLWDEPTADAIAKTDQWISVVQAQEGNYQVLGMKFCYVDGWNQDFTYYRDHMLELERTYPGKIFIWSTSALWNDPGSACQDNGFNSCSNIAEFNQQVRDFAKANHKPLYDVADIESHDPNGNPCLTDGYEGLCDAYYNGYGGGGGGHPNPTGSIRLAKGFWYLMALIGGWTDN